MIVESEMKQKKETSRGIYSEIYDLIVNLADEAEMLRISSRKMGKDPSGLETTRTACR